MERQKELLNNLSNELQNELPTERQKELLNKLPNELQNELPMECQKKPQNKLSNELQNEWHAVRQKSSILDVKSRLPKSTGWMPRLDEVLKPTVPQHAPMQSRRSIRFRSHYPAIRNLRIPWTTPQW